MCMWRDEMVHKVQSNLPLATSAVGDHLPLATDFPCTDGFTYKLICPERPSAVRDQRPRFHARWLHSNLL